MCTADTNSSGARLYNVCITEANLGNQFTGLVFYSLPCFPLAASFSNTVNNTMEENEDS